MSIVTRTLYRPVGLREMELIVEAEAKAFPPRLPEQPSFYPALTFEYADQIAHEWNTKDPKSGFAGFVTEFEVDKVYVERFEEHTVGASKHCELWIPALELDTFNQHIKGCIRIKAAYYGEGYTGPKHWYKDWNADRLFVALYRTSLHSAQDFSGEMTMNRNAILLNYKYWITRDFSDQMSEVQKASFLRHIAELWALKFPEVHLFGSELIG